jgi:hypothetical protein
LRAECCPWRGSLPGRHLSRRSIGRSCSARSGCETPSRILHPGKAFSPKAASLRHRLPGSGSPARPTAGSFAAIPEADAPCRRRGFRKRCNGAALGPPRARRVKPSPYEGLLSEPWLSSVQSLRPLNTGID